MPVFGDLEVRHDVNEWGPTIVRADHYIRVSLEVLTGATPGHMDRASGYQTFGLIVYGKTIAFRTRCREVRYVVEGIDPSGYALECRKVWDVTYPEKSPPVLRFGGRITDDDIAAIRARFEKAVAHPSGLMPQ